MRLSTTSTFASGVFLATPLLVVLLLFAPFGAAQNPAAPPLSGPEVVAVESAIQAFFQGNTALVLTTFSKLSAQLDKEKVPHVDSKLAEHKLPPMAAILAETREALLAQGLSRRLPRVSPREAVILLPEMDRRLRERIQTVKGERVMADPLPTPENIQKYEALFQSAKALGGQLQMIKSIAEYMAQAAKGVSRRQKAKLDEDDQKVLNTDYQTWVTKVEELIQDLAEREIEMRINRLELATRNLEKPVLDKEKFLSAATWSIDAAAATAFLESGSSKGDSRASRTSHPYENDSEKAHAESQKYQRDRLNDPRLRKHVKEHAAKAKELAGDLTIKAQLLAEGINWWLRGRYGVGPEVFGLAKSPWAMVSPIAQMGLFMPLKPPKPTDPAQQVATKTLPQPLFDRRHHYWWAWEDRRVYRNACGQTSDEIISWSSDTSTQSKTFW